MRIALHACCGPCLLEPFDALAAKHDIVVVYANPNIHPLAEYERRRDALLTYAEQCGIEVVELAYEPARWMRAVAGVESDPVQRCEACFELRLSMVAEEASARGLDAIATTLTVSPYQDVEAITRSGVRAAERAGVKYVPSDFRDRYPDSTRRSRELGMYRQSYCGCLLSEIDARRERESRRAARAAQKR